MRSLPARRSARTLAAVARVRLTAIAGASVAAVARSRLAAARVFGIGAVRALPASLGLALIAGACGYSTGLAMPEHARSIGVAIFGNDSLERDLEPRLYDEISRAVRDWANAPLVAPDHAELVMRGKITSYHRRSGVRNPENQLLESAIYIEVDASLYRAGGDRPIRGPVHVTSSTGYLVPLPDSVAVVHDRGVLEDESVARDRTLHNIADKLVLDLLAPVN
jgi:hypothetical protein